jgi:hypothetical protein
VSYRRRQPGVRREGGKNIAIGRLACSNRVNSLPLSLLSEEYMMRTVTVMAFLVCCALVGGVRAEDNEEKAPTGSDERSAKTIVYAVRNAPANVLAGTLAQFLEESGGRVVADPISNVLLIQTAAEDQDRVLAVLQQLDRTLSTFRIQLLLLKAQGEGLAGLDTASLSGRTDEVLKSIELLKSTGRVHVANRIELTAVENQPASLQAEEVVPRLAATYAVPGGGGSSNYTLLSLGTQFKVEARLSGESDIVLVVDFEKSDIEQPSVVTEESSSAPQIVSRLTLQTTVRVQDGHSVLIGAPTSQTNDEVKETYVVLSATIDPTEKTKPVAAIKAFSPELAPIADAKPRDPKYLAYYEKLLDKYDQNKDKALDAEERSTMSKDCAEADTDKDGLVNVEELARWHMKR